ncbi:oleate hydratase [Acidipropionibacterium timonense]|uniref:oleate hydratase n=1 Tax=Acidipropionibacterium timonense TaxID=2161818 RepID=UPI00102FDC05|nr:oleate hydratase [Acidipropionibacterium timonense]
MTNLQGTYQRSFQTDWKGRPFVGNDQGHYTRNSPVHAPDVAERHAYLVGAGIASLTAAGFLVRDAGMPAGNITILESSDIAGGSFDGGGNVEEGFIARGGREMGQHFECFWDIMKDVPALELPGHSVLDEFRLTNENDPNRARTRIIHDRGVPRDAHDMGLNRKGQLAVVRLLLAKESQTWGRTIEDWFDEDFLHSTFYTLWKTMFAFEEYESLTEMKRYLHRFLQYLPGFPDFSCLRFSRYNQFESFILPLRTWLTDQGVQFRYDTVVEDLDIDISPTRKVVRALRVRHHDGSTDSIPVGERDVVLVTNGSCTEATTYGDMDHVAPYTRNPGGDCWTLWRNLAAKSADFGRPEVFSSDTDKTLWISVSFNFIGRDHPFLRRIQELSGNDPLAGRTVTGGIITAEDSSWCCSLTMNRQPQFRAQPSDWGVAWAYGLYPFAVGDCVRKPMVECTGEEILKEFCFHFGLIDEFDEIRAHTKVRTAAMPYITAFFMPRTAGDRPEVVPHGCVNLGFLGQFVETPDDCIFTTEGSARTAMMAVYQLMDVDRDIPPIFPAQYDIRALLHSGSVLAGGKLPGEWLLRRLLGRTYYADILP